MKKIIIAVMALIMTLVPFCASASQSDVYSYSNAEYTFSTKDYIDEDFYMKQGKKYIAPELGTLRVEEGATLYIDGDFQVVGTLKNYGKIIIRDVTAKDPRKEPYTNETIGRLAVSGKLINYGSIEVVAAEMECLPAGSITNRGTITLKNDVNPDITLFRILSRTTPQGGVQKGELENTKHGKIYISNTEGNGLVVSQKAKYTNNGEVLAGK